MIKKLKISVLILCIVLLSAAAPMEEGLPIVMLTGYWNPTGKMIAQFCTDPSLNPSGWQGGNWESFGFDLYSFFPDPETYTGFFEVDYQDTWEDFWHITDSLRPTAIISFGAAPTIQWEIECNARNLIRWQMDSEYPLYPTPTPPDSTVEVNFARHSTLPVQEIADAVNSQTDVTAIIDSVGFLKQYLCEYMAYLGMWYKAQHDSANDPYYCQAAGFIHVGDSTTVTLAQAKEAAQVSIREVLKTLTVTKVLASVSKHHNEVSLVNYPNSVHTATIVAFTLPVGQQVSLNLYDTKGRIIAKLLNEHRNSGKHCIELKSSDVVSGIYFCRLETQKNCIVSSKLTIMK